MKIEVVSKYFQSVLCKFGECCKRQHNKEIGLWHCEYTASSKTVLKRYIIINHKEDLKKKISFEQCDFKCDSELILKHHMAKKITKPEVVPPPYSDIDPSESNSECAYFTLEFKGKHAYGKHLTIDHKYFYFCGSCQTQFPHIYNIHISSFHPGVQYEKPFCYNFCVNPLPTITEIHWQVWYV